jgi:histidinol-phosphate/aromatic aminotransferase/cobyric acid decarboxylase-like protein
MLNELSGLYHMPECEAKFLLIKVKDIKTSSRAFEKSKIAVRMFSSGALKNYIRVTVGMPSENRLVLQILKRGV